MASISGGDSEHGTTQLNVVTNILVRGTSFWAVLSLEGNPWIVLEVYIRISVVSGLHWTGKGTKLVISDNVHILYRVWGVFGTHTSSCFFC